MRQNKTTSVDVATLVKSVQADMLNSEKGGQWLLSSYAPFKEKPTFPGFEDLLFEEVRLGFYDANAAGTIEEYKRKLQESLQNAAQRVRLLQEPNEHVAQTLLQLYNASVDMGQCTTSPLQHDALSTSAPSAAPGAALARSSHLTAPPPFAAVVPTPAMPFASQAPDVTPPPTGAAASTTSPFASVLNQRNIFAQSSSMPTPPPNNNIFAGGNIFTGSTGAVGGNLFSAPQKPPLSSSSSGGNLFASTPTTPTLSTPTSGIFAQAMQNYQAKQTDVSGAFTTPPQNIFAQAAQKYVPPAAAATVPPIANFFGTTCAANSPLMQASGPANTTATTVSLPSAIPSTDDPIIYTPQDDLSPEALAAYNAATFEFGGIPTSPPPVNLCA